MTAFDRLGKTYLAFAKREPAYYSAMFEAGVPLDTDRELREASENAFAVLRAAAEKLVSLMPSQGRPPALMVALHVWAMTHGIASLFGRGDAVRRALPMPPEGTARGCGSHYLRGTGTERIRRRATLSQAIFPRRSGAMPCGSPI
jgi:hypothetical protein